MLFFQKVLLVIYAATFIIGLTYLFLYYKKRKQIDVKNDLEFRNHKLNLMLGIIFSVGAIITGVLIPFLG